MELFPFGTRHDGLKLILLQEVGIILIIKIGAVVNQLYPREVEEEIQPEAVRAYGNGLTIC